MIETSEPLPQPFHKRHMRAVIIALLVCLVVGGVLAALFWPETKALFAWGKNLLLSVFSAIQAAGPGWFFAAFAILPAFGSPLSLFTFTVRPTFGEQIGLGWVIGLSALCLAFNIAFSYWLARYALRPVIEKIVKKLGYKLPHAADDEHVAICVLLRVVPGPPYCVQSYILGLAKVRFLPYMLISFAGQFGWTLAAIFFADALMKGGAGKTGFIALTLVIALVIGTRLLRKRYAKKVPLGTGNKN